MKNKEDKKFLIGFGIFALVVAAILIFLFLQPFAPSQQISTIEEELLSGVKTKFFVSSLSLKENELIPTKYTRDGDNLSPPLNWSSVPNETKSLAIIMYDLDAPSGIFYHWIFYNIPKNINSIPEGIQKSPITPYGYQGINSYNTLGYDGPSPPTGSTHRYVFLILALDTELALGPNAYYSEVLSSIKGHVIAYAKLTCLYRGG
jgi:Raf kinase inhibitor-like YbhB/YbcL family protein